jgi:hypothetical protein
MRGWTNGLRAKASINRRVATAMRLYVAISASVNPLRGEGEAGFLGQTCLCPPLAACDPFALFSVIKYYSRMRKESFCMGKWNCGLIWMFFQVVFFGTTAYSIS